MSNRNIVCASLICALGVPTVGHAELYRFKVDGDVAYSIVPGVAPGHPVIIDYIVDSQDQRPDLPTWGYYAITNLTMKFPDLTLTALSDPSPRVAVELFGVADVVTCGAKVTSGGPQIYNDAGFQFEFLGGTLPSDALPLSLPLNEATIARFLIAPFDHPHISGTVTSYEIVIVPEPFTSAIVVVGTLMVVGRMHRFAY